jgi:hypothetical protein
MEAQPNFPRVDLSESNAEILEFLLASKEQLEIGHEGAEAMAWVYKVGHRAMRLAFENTAMPNSVQGAVDHGVVTYEAICMMVGHLPDSRNFFTVNAQAVTIAHRRTADLLVDYIAEAREGFARELPRTMTVVQEASGRFWGPMARYAVDGAALARQFELDSAA